MLDPIRAVVSLLLLAVTTVFVGAAETSETPFHLGTNKPGWDEKTQKRLEACAADFHEALHGRKPVLAQPDPRKESNASEQFYQGDGYQLHVLKSKADLDGVAGFVFGAILEFEPELATGEMHSILHTTFYTAEDMANPEPSATPFRAGRGKNKPAWSKEAQKRVDACTADYKAVIEGKKPIHAKPPKAEATHFYKGNGYQLDIIEAPLVIGGVAGFLYGPMLDLEPGLASEGEDSLFHVTFYTADQMKKLLGR